MIVNVHAAKTTFSKLIERAENGEEVIIARAGMTRDGWISKYEVEIFDR